MTQWHQKARRKSSGGIRTAKRRRDKRLTEKGGLPTHTVITDEDERRTVKKGRGSHKVKERRAKFATIADPKTKKASKAEILTVEENNANRLFVRRNIITKGAVIKIKLAGKEEKAKVTSRPGQQGQVQATLITQQEKKK
jgi:small subunit ribosomal protein S8e